MSVLLARPEEVVPERRPFFARGAAVSLLRERAGEVLVSGPAGTGKSRACCEKVHLCCERYPGCRWLIVRKTRESLTESTLVTWEDKVVPAGHPILTNVRRDHRPAYRYPNGSAVVVSGLRQSGRDMTQKVMSTDYDGIYVPEAIELSEDEWERLTTRLRNGVMPYQQLIADTNPDRPGHWLKRRCDSGGTVLLESRHEDNPELWDPVAGAWTARGEKYIATLDKLTGPRYQRLRRGRWVQAEGLVYDGWDASLHLVPRFPIPATWSRYWSIDFGYTNPFLCQWWAQDPDGRLYRYREIYRTQRLVEDHAKQMLRLSGYTLRDGRPVPVMPDPEPLPRAIICDHDAEDRATLERHLGLKTVGAQKSVSAGIQAVAGRLQRAGDGRPRLLLLRDSLVERDERLDEAKLPTCTEEEIDGYTWDTANGRKKGEVPEVPVDRDNHGMDGLRYLVAHFDLKPPAGRPAASSATASPAWSYQPR